MRKRQPVSVFACVVVLLGSSSSSADDHASGGGLDLELLVREAADNHPAGAAASSAHLAAQQVPSQAGSLPDPVLATSVQNLRLDEFGLGEHPMTGIQVGLTQAIPFPGKLPLRERAAQRAVDVAAAQIIAVDSALELRVRERYWALHFAERAETLVRESERALNLLTDVVHARYSVGQGAQQDALQAQVAHSRLRAELRRRAQDVQSARRALSTAVGRPPGTNLAATRPPRRVPLLPRARLAAMATHSNPGLRVSGASVGKARADVEAAHRDRLPDFAVGLGYRLRAAAPGDMSNGADMVSVTLAMNLPVWAGSKQNARTRQARRLLSQQIERRASIALDVQDAVARSVDEVERLVEQLRIYEKEILPQADQALGASISDYQVGRVEFVSVLQNWRTQLSAQLAFEKLRTDHARRIATLRALCGGPVERPQP